jgi:hypothetical protein
LITYKLSSQGLSYSQPAKTGIKEANKFPTWGNANVSLTLSLYLNVLRVNQRREVDATEYSNSTILSKFDISIIMVSITNPLYPLDPFRALFFSASDGYVVRIASTIRKHATPATAVSKPQSGK